jgi:hypothetical protein
MAPLLEVVLTFAATMLVLALAAQSLQDIVKFTFAIKAWTRLTALRRLVRESASAAGLGESDGDDIAKAVLARLGKLSQRGFFQKNVRLDVLDKQQLMELVRAVNPQQVSALRPLVRDVGLQRLGDVAHEIEKWFELAMEPVTERYRRRMRLGAILSAAVVVALVNASAFDLLKRARTDPRFRAAAQQQAAAFWTADSVARVLEDSARRRGTAAAAGLDSAVRAAAGRRQTLAVAVVQHGDSSLFLGYPKHFKPSFSWAFGMLIATLLVSLGAPLWHDVLEGVLGWKNRIRGQATGGGAPVAPAAPKQPDKAKAQP